MKLAKVLAFSVALAVGTVGVIETADASSRGCREFRKHKANRGTAYGAVGGAVLGNVIAGGHNKTEGTLLGGAVGAVAGHEIAKKNAKCRYKHRRHHR
jgi:uncharacterized protein YcfJ